MAVQMFDKPDKPGFYKIELFKTVWEVPERYQDLSPIGTGAYGTVWYVAVCNVAANKNSQVSELKL